MHRPDGLPLQGFRPVSVHGLSSGAGRGSVSRLAPPQRSIIKDDRRPLRVAGERTRRAGAFRPRPMIRDPRQVYFFARFGFAPDPQRFLKQSRHRASWHLMKLGARSFEPQCRQIGFHSPLALAGLAARVILFVTLVARMWREPAFRPRGAGASGSGLGAAPICLRFFNSSSVIRLPK